MAATGVVGGSIRETGRTGTGLQGDVECAECGDHSGSSHSPFALVRVFTERHTDTPCVSPFPPCHAS